MRIYFGHSTQFDFQRDLYEPIKRSALYGKHECILPHEGKEQTQREKSFYKTIDLFVAEVSVPSTGLGIELGWANDAGCQIVCVHKAGARPSSALGSVCRDVWAYASDDELVELVERAVLSTSKR